MHTTTTAAQPAADRRDGTWPFAALDPVQARNHQRATVQVRSIAAQAQQARLDACLQLWRRTGGAPL